MKNKKCIQAIFTPSQFEKFNKTFNIKPSELEVNFDGWHKHVLMSGNKVFLFPRNPEYIKGIKKELELYAEFSHLKSVALPKLIKKVKDKEISFYEFGVVTKLNGTSFSKFQKKVSIEKMEKLLVNLSKAIAVWHNIPLKELPKLLKQSNKKQGNLSIKNWGKKVLFAKETKKSVDFIHDYIIQTTNEYKINNIEIDDNEVKYKWNKAIKELANLSDTLVHADIHEDQVLVESEKTMRITGILDWEMARVDNPVWDFNFGEWGLEIWKWSDDFALLRREMWKEYLKKRKLKLSTLEGLHLFYTLLEFTWLIELKQQDKIIITGKSFEKSLQIYLNRMIDITKLL